MIGPQLPQPQAIRAIRDAPSASFELLCPATVRVPPSPKFTFGTFEAPLARWYYGASHLHAGGLFKLRDFCVSHPYLLSKDGVVYCCPEANIHPGHTLAALQGRDLPRTPIRLSGQFVMITGPGYPIYGHWLSDFLPKLAVLNGLGYDLGSLKFLVPHDVPAFGLEWLDLLGFHRDNIVEFDLGDTSREVEELLIPTTLHNGVRGSTLYRNAADLLLDRVRAQHPSVDDAGDEIPVFLSRAKSSQSRELLNRSAIEEEAASRGIALCHPQELSLLDQIRLFRKSRVIVGEYGSALHGSLFSRPGTVVCAIRGSRQHPAFIQSGIGNILRQHTGYIFGANIPGDPAERFSVSLEDFRACLDSVVSGEGFDDRGT
ncbi:MAG TPA: glycosyltransferase family 61 protein [Acetobacteraceae bacterium]|nr:glycosyltransferase family 61 protein [Acetobacteraceae bacterium]